MSRGREKKDWKPSICKNAVSWDDNCWYGLQCCNSGHQPSVSRCKGLQNSDSRKVVWRELQNLKSLNVAAGGVRLQVMVMQSLQSTGPDTALEAVWCLLVSGVSQPDSAEPHSSHWTRKYKTSSQPCNSWCQNQNNLDLKVWLDNYFNQSPKKLC